VESSSSHVLNGAKLQAASNSLSNIRLTALANIEIKFLAGFLLAAGLLLFGGAFTYRSSVRFAESVARVGHGQEVRANLADVYGSLSGARLAARDYLLYGQPEQSDEYRHLTEVIRYRIATLKSLTVDDPIEQGNAHALDAVVESRVDDLASALVAYQHYGLPAARALMRIQQQLSGTRDREVESITDQMKGIEARLQAQRQADTEQIRKGTLISLVATLSVAFAMFFALFRGIQREMRGRRAAEAALRASEQLSEEAIRDLNAELREKANQLETLNKELESFTYTVSHDLRAPLRAIDGFALMIEEDCKDRLSDEGKRHLEVIRGSSKKMGLLIDDLLVFSRLGRQPIASREVNIESIVREVIEEAARSNPIPQIEVGRLPLARGDSGLLRQVWINLISNAIKYSGKASQPLIQVTGSRVGTENHYSVRDNGVGFDMAYADKLFGVLQRLHGADEFEGAGVGLAIVHRIVTRHGGRVWAEGKINQGAVFSFALPSSLSD
jgi:signal transduction histidine kinase